MSIWTELLQVITRRSAGTRVLEAGKGETLILLHGQGGHAENFRHNIPEYSRYFRVLAIDMRWHGLSDKAGTPDQLIPELVQGVVDLLDAEGIQACYLEGQSLGGWVAARLAIQHPERVKGLVLTTPMGMGAAKETRAEVLSGWRDSQHRALGDVSAASIKTRMSSLFADPSNLDDEIVGVRAAIYRDSDTNEALKAVASSYFNAEQAERYTITDEELGEITIPTLVYWGTHNDPFPPEIGKFVAAAIPKSTFYCAEAGHWAQYENPAEHNKVVTDFLRSLSDIK